MQYKRLLAIFSILLIFSCINSEGSAQTKNRGKEPPQPCPDEMVYTGKYRNRRFGFSIIIPAGLKAYWNSLRCSQEDEGCICFPDHGRIIRLEAPAHIEAYTGYETLGWSLREHENYDIASMKKKQGVKNFKVLSSKWIRLDKLKARRYVFGFFEKDRDFITENIIAIHKGVQYTLTLFTPAERYQKNRRRFEKVWRSWRLTPMME